MQTILGAFFLVMLVLVPAYAQEAASPTFEDRIPEEVKGTPAGFFTFTTENDYFGGDTDENYTNGVRLTYYDYGAEPPWFADLLDRWVPTFRVNETTSTYYSIGQNLYTPKNITASVPDPTDRPYAAFLYTSAGMTSISGNHVDDLEATLGIVGPWALGRQTQQFVHDNFGFDHPAGWEYQLKNEPGLMLSWQRQWPEAFYMDIDALIFRTSPHIGLTLGNIYTYAATGVSFQITPKQYQWQSKPLRVRPAIPGNGYFAVPENKFAWSLFAGAEGRAMGRNIFLDGNTFRDSPSVDKKYGVVDLNAGVSVTYGRTQISYTLNWRSKEFDGQQDSSVFGAISVGYRF